jgi:outer membrane murein-binding lipoprotein Lpp
LLAHPACNRSKSDALAARVHLERWVERLDRDANAIAQVGQAAGIKSDREALDRVARWAYQMAFSTNTKAWIETRRFEPVDAGYLGVFRAS